MGKKVHVMLKTALAATVLLATAPGYASTGRLMRITQLCLARQMESPSTLSNYVDRVAAMGYDTIHLYITGRVETPTFALPEGERYSADEIRALVAHAAAKGLEVVPYAEIYGHADLFFKHPGLDHLAEESKGEPRLPGKVKQNFCLSDPRAREFLRNYMRDLAALFPSRNFNVGLDETWNAGVCPDCRERERRGELYAEAVLFFHDELRKLGKRMWMWDDYLVFHPGTLERLPRDIVMCHWDYDPLVSDLGSRNNFSGRLREDLFAQYDRLGFEAIGCTYYNNPGNLERLFAYVRRHRSTVGYMMTFWGDMRLNFQSCYLPLNAAMALMMDDPAKYASRDPVPDGVRRVLPSLSETEALAAAGIAYRGHGCRGLGASIAGLRTGFPAYGGIAAREASVAILKASRFHPGAGAVDADPFSERAILDDLVCRAEADICADRLTRLSRPFADLRRTPDEIVAAKAGLRALADEIACLADRRKRQAACWRGRWNDPNEIGKPFETALKNIETLLKAPETPAGPDEKYLELVLSQPDPYGWLYWKVSGRFGDAWRTLADGQWKPVAGERAVFERRFPFESAEFPSELKIEHHGYGRAQLAYASVVGVAGRAVPRKVLAVTGDVEHPERLLADDWEWADFGTPGFLEKFHFRDDYGRTESVTLGLAVEK